MVKTKNEELFKILMSNDFNLGEYNFETPYGSVKLVKFIENNVNKDFVKVELSLNGILILTLKDVKDFPDGLVEGLYWQNGNDNLEIYNIVNEEDFTIYCKPSKSSFQKIEIENNYLYRMKDELVSNISAEICDNVIFWDDGPISYDLDEKQFYLDIDNDGEWENFVSFNSVDELIKLKEKVLELKKLGDLGIYAANLVQKYIFNDIDLKSLEKNANGFRKLVDFYNKYYVNREDIYKQLDSNPVFKEVEEQVKAIIKEQGKNKQGLTRTKEL